MTKRLSNFTKAYLKQVSLIVLTVQINLARILPNLRGGVIIMTPTIIAPPNLDKGPLNDVKDYMRYIKDWMEQNGESWDSLQRFHYHGEDNAELTAIARHQMLLGGYTSVCIYGMGNASGAALNQCKVAAIVFYRFGNKEYEWFRWTVGYERKNQDSPWQEVNVITFKGHPAYFRDF